MSYLYTVSEANYQYPMPDLIQFAIPAFVGLLLIEAIVNAVGRHDWFDPKDTAASISMGLGNVAVHLIDRGLVYGAYLYLYLFRLFDIGATWWSWGLLFLADDFSYYWFHRISHQCRFFWASHVIHHSSRKYNLGTALRQTWTGNLTGTFLFWAWLPILGYHPIMVMTMQSVSLLYQFWIHTEAIDRLPRPIEFIFNTPSHHRVHHSSEVKYLDKNHAGSLIIWDRLFGTFQQEEEHPVYGLTRNLETYNPFRIAFHEWAEIWRDLRRPLPLRARIGYLFGPPGWSHDGTRKTTRQLRAEQSEAG